MLRRFGIVFCAAILGVSTAAGALLLLRDAPADVTASAAAFLATLGESEKAKATMSFDDPRRLKWHFIPLAERKGLQIKEMKPEQRIAALALLKTLVSQVGYQKAEVIMSLEGLLRELEKTRVGGPIRDPERYYWTIFGTPIAKDGLPSAKGTWGVSVEGHHMSLNFVVTDGKLSAFTPSMFGSNPATVHRHDFAGGAAEGTRILSHEEDGAFALLKSLDPEQRKRAVIAEKAPADVRAAGEAQAPQTAPEGLPAAEMKPEQVALLKTLLKTYLDNMPAATAQERMAELEKEGIEKTYFAWAGADRPGIGHYYRLQGPSLLVEFVNVQPDAAGNPANHIHAVWRDLRGDFGLPAK